MTLKDERIWFLRRVWGVDGWRALPWVGIEKIWDAHAAKLLKDGMIEEDNGLFRITDKGKEALK